jgi:hypothetical protein
MHGFPASSQANRRLIFDETDFDDPRGYTNDLRDQTTAQYSPWRGQGPESASLIIGGGANFLVGCCQPFARSVAHGFIAVPMVGLNSVAKMFEVLHSGVATEKDSGPATIVRLRSSPFTMVMRRCHDSWEADIGKIDCVSHHKYWS